MIKKPTKSEINWWLQKITRKRSFSNNEEPYLSDTPKFLEELNNVINGDTKSDISINIQNVRKNVVNLFAEKFVIENNIPRISILNFDIDKTVHIKNLAIGELIITSPGPTPNIVVENCLIKELKITNVAINLQLKKSGIFNLNIPGNSLYNFDVDGGFILNIQCPATCQSNPISGSVTIKNAHLGTKKINGKLAEAQGYRNIRHHLQQLQNPLAASKFHAAELRTDRETDDNWISKLVSYFYDWFSGYGNSISQPIFWFFGLMIAFTLATFFFDKRNPV